MTYVCLKLSFCTVVYPAIILAYLGQGTRLIHNGADILPNVFYTSIPGPHSGRDSGTGTPADRSRVDILVE